VFVSGPRRFPGGSPVPRGSLRVPRSSPVPRGSPRVPGWLVGWTFGLLVGSWTFGLLVGSPTNQPTSHQLCSLKCINLHWGFAGIIIIDYVGNNYSGKLWRKPHDATITNSVPDAPTNAKPDTFDAWCITNAKTGELDT
jgi:hypothetical protein